MENELLNAIREVIKEELQPLHNDIQELKQGQNDIKDMIRNLESTNANNHLKI